MNALLALGRWLLLIPIFVFGIFHLMNASALAPMAPGGEIMVYFSGVCLILASISMLLGIWDKLSATLLGVILLLFIIPHVQLLGNDPEQMSQILKNTVMASAAFMYARYVARDNRYMK